MAHTKLFGFLTFSVALMLGTSALAFGGGGGGGRTSQYYERHGGKGVTNIGIHYHIHGHQGDFCLYDLTHDPNAEEVQPGVYECKGGTVLNCNTGVCTACPAGTYAAAGDQSCSTTPAGSYTPEGASEPVPCPIGTYSASAGATECTPAEPGYYTNQPGATEVIECEPGYYCPGGTDHMQAQPGHYVPTSGAHDQTLADPGYYVDTAGATAQTQCQPGTYTDSSAATTPKQAQPGYYVPTAGATSQIPADPGYYVDTAGATAQTICPAGTYTSTTASTSCQQTDPGYEPAVPTPDDEVPCTDTVTKGACGCPPDLYADGEGNCYAGQCANVWINECTPSCTQADGPQKLADGTACQNNLGTCQNGGCCAGDTCATEQLPELYCSNTNNQGQCESWGTCEEGHSTANRIVGLPSAWGACADEGDELYCSGTNGDGQCESWSTCQEGMSSTDSIIDMPNAGGVCASEGDEVYCSMTNDAGQCTSWSICQAGMSSTDKIVNVPSAYGTCASEGYEVYCSMTNDAGQCTSWSTCQEGMSTQDWIVDIPIVSGACASEGYELYCDSTNDDGQCTIWGTCPEGRSTQDWIVNLPNAIGACAFEGNELYCDSTNDAGQCTSWNTCQAGKSSKDWIVNTPNATGSCCDEGQVPQQDGTCATGYCKTADSNGNCTEYAACPSGNYKDATATSNGICAEAGQEIYCAYMGTSGTTCQIWETCAIGKSTLDWIVEAPNMGATGACAAEGEEVSCERTDSNGICFSWVTCPTGKGLGDRKLAPNGIVSADGSSYYCATDEYPEWYCSNTDYNGKCLHWSTCEEGRSTQDWIIGTQNATGWCCDEGQIPQHDGTCATGYCKTTDSNGNCTEYAACPSGNYKNATATAIGVCADNTTDNIYCSVTTSNGVCTKYKTCSAGHVIGDPEGIPLNFGNDDFQGSGICCGEGEETYCAQTSFVSATSQQYSGGCINYGCYNTQSERKYCIGVGVATLRDPNGTCRNEYKTSIDDICCEEEMNGFCDHTLSSCSGTLICADGYEKYCAEEESGTCVRWGCCQGDNCPTTPIQGTTYCSATDDSGVCLSYSTCPEGQAVGDPEGVANNWGIGMGGQGVCCPVGKQPVCAQKTQDSNGNAGGCFWYDGCYDPTTQRLCDSVSYDSNGVPLGYKVTNINYICSLGTCNGFYFPSAEFSSPQWCDELSCADGYEKYCHEEQSGSCVSWGCCKGDACPQEPSCPTARQCGDACCDEGFSCQSGKCRTYCSDIGAYCTSCMRGGGYDCLEASRPSVSDYGYTCFNDGNNTTPIFNATQSGCQAFCSATYISGNGGGSERNYTPGFDSQGIGSCCDDQGFAIGADHISEACCNAFSYPYVPYAYGWYPYYSYEHQFESGPACCLGEYASISTHYGFGFHAKECAITTNNKENYCSDCSSSGSALSSQSYQSECVTPCTEWGIWED